MKCKKGSIELSSEFIVKLILGLMLIIVVISLFSSMVPFLSKQPLLAKLMIIMAIVVLYEHIVWILIKIGFD